MKSQKNAGRAEQLYADCPTGTVQFSEAIVWLLKAVNFLLARYIDGE